MPGSNVHATLHVLSQKLRTATDLFVPWVHFHDQVAADSRFITEADHARNQRVEEVVCAIAASQHIRHKPTDVALYHLAFEGFWHGCCRLGRRYVVLFYFEELDMGLMGLMDSLMEASEVLLVRFTAFNLPRNAAGQN